MVKSTTESRKKSKGKEIVNPSPIKHTKLIQKTLTIQETNLPTGPSDDRWEERGFMNEKAKVAGMNANKRIAKTIVASS